MRVENVEDKRYRDHYKEMGKNRDGKAKVFKNVEM